MSESHVYFFAPIVYNGYNIAKRGKDAGFRIRRELMVIKHNLSAINADRMFGKTEKAKRKNMEKLSSGYKINRAADDAAGLSISEKMRRQIRGTHAGIRQFPGRYFAGTDCRRCDGGGT